MREALGKLYAGFENLAVAGRTDAGVHALGQVASVEVKGGPPVENAAEALNTMLPDDLSVTAAAEPPDGFDARRSAQARSYRYRIWRRRTPSPFEQKHSWWHPRPIDESKLAVAATCYSASTTSAPSRRPRRSTPSSSARCGARPGTCAVTRSSSRSPRTASSATWCGRWSRTMLEQGPEGDREAARGPGASGGGLDRAAVGSVSRFG